MSVGCCCIDEFDKLTCDPAVLLEAMEQQSVSVARGGLVANLPARAAVLAAANPVSGHYDITRRLDENLRIPPALLSRYKLSSIIVCSCYILSHFHVKLGLRSSM
ncbi:unnamed protein product [Trichobilharzia regenti]|nr:unnamed protein product [Trichobilharzia regenti]